MRMFVNCSVWRRRNMKEVCSPSAANLARIAPHEHALQSENYFIIDIKTFWSSVPFIKYGSIGLYRISCLWTIYDFVAKSIDRSKCQISQKWCCDLRNPQRPLHWLEIGASAQTIALSLRKYKPQNTVPTLAAANIKPSRQRLLHHASNAFVLSRAVERANLAMNYGNRTRLS